MFFSFPFLGLRVIHRVLAESALVINDTQFPLNNISLFLSPESNPHTHHTRTLAANTHMYPQKKIQSVS